MLLQLGQAYFCTSTIPSDGFPTGEDVDDVVQASCDHRATVFGWSHTLILLAVEKLAGLLLHDEASIPLSITGEPVEAEGSDSAICPSLVVGIYEGSA